MAQGNLRFVLDAGHGCMDLYELERAEQHWRQALKLDPQCEEALVQLAETKRSLHDIEGARRLLRECLLHHPESEEAQTFLAELEAN
jgi:Tfp pilus assembly protein PilF